MRIRSILPTLLLTAVVAPALAIEPAAPVSDAPRETREAAPAADAERERGAVDRHCLRETGTRIRVRSGQRHCTAFAGRVWTREDLERTGQTDIGDALRMLDVSIR